MQPTFQGEVQFRRYSDTSAQGAQIVLGLADRDELQAFVGKEGKRFMAVLVEIGDDEKPVEQKESIGPLCRLAVQWCKREDFAEWIRPMYDSYMGGDGSGWGDVTPAHVGGLEAWCRHVICVMCGVESRKELDRDTGSADAFKELILEPFKDHLFGESGQD